MGTNYYAIRKADDNLKNELKVAIDQNDFEKVINLTPKKVHLGKKSAGWVFLFNHNDWQYYGQKRDSIDGIDSFINGSQIVDEYGYSLSLDEFWAIVNGSSDLKKERQYGSIFDGLNYSNHIEFS